MPLTLGYTNIFDLAGHGAQETLYWQPASDDLSAALEFVRPLTDKRRPLLGKQASVKAIKVFVAETAAGVASPRLSQLEKLYLPGNNAQGSAESGISLQVQFISNTRLHKKLMNQVAPWDSIFDNQDSLNTGIAGWLGHWNSWSAAIIAAKMGWFRTVWGANHIVSGYVLDPVNGVVTFTFAAPGVVWPKGIGEPQKVKLRFPGKNPIEGVQVVIPMTATTAVLSHAAGVRPFFAQGTLQLPSRVFAGVGSTGAGQVTGVITPQNPVGRKRGKPLLASRGRVIPRPKW